MPLTAKHRQLTLKKGRQISQMRDFQTKTAQSCHRGLQHHIDDFTPSVDYQHKPLGLGTMAPRDVTTETLSVVVLTCGWCESPLYWLFWLQGSAPYLGGGFGHFYAYAPEKFEYPINRFAMEAKRQLDVLDRNLADRAFLAGDEYTIADMATAPWYGGLVKGWQYGAAEFLDVASYKHVNRWMDEIAERPAFKRGRMVNRTWGEDGQVPERHDASDFDGQL